MNLPILLNKKKIILCKFQTSNRIQCAQDLMIACEYFISMVHIPGNIIWKYRHDRFRRVRLNNKITFEANPKNW